MFEFTTATRIIFGTNSLSQLGRNIADFGKKILLVHSGNGAKISDVVFELEQSSLKYMTFPVVGEPSLDVVLDGVRLGKEFDCDLVIAFGGGSAIDTGKAVAAFLANPGDPLDYLEVIGRGKPFPNRSYPWVAIPTTAGTGSEVTRNAVLTIPEKCIKVSLRSQSMYAQLALIDPLLAVSLPPRYTASTGMDALTQLIEPFVCNRSNEMVDMFCREGIKNITRSLELVYRDGENVSARTGMAWASLLGGLSLANAGLGAVHGFASVIGGMYTAPHGEICACLLPIVTEVNVRALRARMSEHPVLEKYLEISQMLTGNPDATIEDGIAWLITLKNKLRIPSLITHSVLQQDIPEIVLNALKASSMKANPIQLSDEELTEIMERAL